MSDSEEEDVVLKEADKLKMTIVNTVDNTSVQLVVKLTTTFAKVFAGWGKTLQLDQKRFRFNYDGEKILDDQNAKMLEWKSGRTYVIEAFFEQIGGNIAGRVIVEES